MDTTLAQVGDKRLQEMRDLYVRGATLEEIGERFGVSRQRVQQLFQEAGLSTRSARETASLRRTQLLREREEEIVVALALVGDVRSVARDLNVSQIVVRDVMKAHFPAGLPRRHHRPRSAVYSSEQLLACLKQAGAAASGPLSAAAYRDYAADRHLDDGHSWPSVHTFVSRFGSWREALLQAGLSTSRRLPPTRRQFSVEDCLQALRIAVGELGGPPTIDAYTTFVRSFPRSRLPSAMTIRNRLGGWQQALERARQ